MAKLYSKNVWVDEVLAAAERYNIKDNVGTPIESNVQIELATAVTQAGTAADATKMNNIEDGVDAVDTLLNTVNTNLGSSPQGSSATVKERIAAIRSLAGATADLIQINGNNVILAAAANIYTTALTAYHATSTITGWSSTTTKLIYYKVIGKLAYVFFDLRGTSDSTEINFTLPITCNTLVGSQTPVRAQDNGTWSIAVAVIAANQSIVRVTKPDGVLTGWTNSGNKAAIGSLAFEIQ